MLVSSIPTLILTICLFFLRYDYESFMWNSGINPVNNIRWSFCPGGLFAFWAKKYTAGDDSIRFFIFTAF